MLCYVKRLHWPPTKPAKKSEQSTAVLFPEATQSTYFGLRVLSRRLAFVLDTSGSMSATMDYDDSEDKRISVMKDELLKLIKSIRKKTYFNVYFFSDRHRKLFKHLVVLSKKHYGEVRKFVKSARAMGGTNLYDPLAEALNDPHVDTIYLLSDGQPTSGKYVQPKEILRNVQKINRVRSIKIHTISIGNDSKLMERLAEDNGGEYRYLE